MLEARRGEQKAVLEEGASIVKPGGRLAYITCSVLPWENCDQVKNFLAGHPQFKLIPWPELWQRSLPATTPVPSADGSGETLLMTPRDHGTDGFFVAVMQCSN
jgi:16S rRNA (cytosine967-C5)-methyltransferase